MSDGGNVVGRIALHGGGEFEAGDELFLDAIVEAARDTAARRAAGSAASMVVVPTAAARSRPTTSGRHGVGALRQTAARLEVDARVEMALVIDRTSAASDALATVLAAADLVYLPGGHPDLIPSIFPGSAAWTAILAAHRRGAVVVGASAGAMALAERTWTPGGWVPALGLVPGLIVAPHFAMIEANLDAWAPAIEELDATRLSRLGLDERTGVLSTDGAWQVAGEGRAVWLAPGAEPIVARHGELLDLTPAAAR